MHVTYVRMHLLFHSRTTVTLIHHTSPVVFPGGVTCNKGPPYWLRTLMWWLHSSLISCLSFLIFFWALSLNGVIKRWVAARLECIVCRRISRNMHPQPQGRLQKMSFHQALLCFLFFSMLFPTPRSSEKHFSIIWICFKLLPASVFFIFQNWECAWKGSVHDNSFNFKLHYVVHE